MKAILGNFTKISESEFHLKKDLQFAQVQLNQDGEVNTVSYQDKQNIEIGDILNFESIDYEIKNINTDKFDVLVVKVSKIDQPEQDVPDKSNFVPRKMTPRVQRPVVMPKKPNVSEEQIDKVIEKITETEKEEAPEVKKIPKASPKVHIPKKRSVFKRFAGWVSSKLSSYSNS